MTIEYPPPPPKAPLPALHLAKGGSPEEIDAHQVASDWVAGFNKHIASGNYSDLSDVFVAETWWRDFLVLTWDIRALQSPSKIGKVLASSSSELSELKLIEDGGLKATVMNIGVVWVQAAFTLTTKAGEGRGCVYLCNTGQNEWKAWVVHTELDSLHTPYSSKTNGTPARGREGTTNGINGTHLPYDHTVLIVGGGQSGLTLGAHLHHRGIPYLIIDNHSATGGAWSARYRSVQAHTPRWSDNWPFMPYPEDFPMWPVQKDIVNWMQKYAEKLGLRTQNETTALNITRNDSGIHSVHVKDNLSGTTSTITAKHLVLATGIFSEVPVSPTFPSQSRFRGLIYHTSRHTSAADIPSITNQRVAVVGSGTSAHDVAQDFANHHAKSVTIIQRGKIFNLSRNAITNAALAPFNPSLNGGQSIEDADLMANALPSSVVRSLGVGLTMQMAQMDKAHLDALTARGVQIKRGEDGDGFPDWLLVKTGCFYIDQGCNEMIIDGRVKWANAGDKGVVDIDDQGVRLGSGETVEADIVVLATGFERNDQIVKKLMGEEVLERVGALGYMDGEGEKIGWWRPTGLPGFWYMTGSFMWARSYSKVLALQIEALESGLNQEYWEE